MPPKPPPGSLLRYDGRILDRRDVLRVALARWPNEPLKRSIHKAIVELLELPVTFDVDATPGEAVVDPHTDAQVGQAAGRKLTATIAGDEVRLVVVPDRR